MKCSKIGLSHNTEYTKTIEFYTLMDEIYNLEVISQ